MSAVGKYLLALSATAALTGDWVGTDAVAMGHT